MCGRGYVSLKVLEFNVLKFTQKCSEPSFFETKSIGDDHLPSEGRINSNFNS
jgi:hypothetical protein